MAMTRKKRRIMLIGIGAAFLVSASVLVGVGMRDSIVFFFSPSEIVEKAPAAGERLRVGGLVVEGSVIRGNGATVSFAVTDGGATQLITFAGVLPDLFREGQGIIAEGALNADRVFIASEVLAKHDEKYMPKEVIDALKEQGVYKEDGQLAASAPVTN
ncbi:MAG: cytochrome c-type biogenesis protein CcmE [Paracoccaceae bacterium]|jgi:cytochrome c-type biogenesis protein CcmE